MTKMHMHSNHHLEHYDEVTGFSGRQCLQLSLQKLDAH